MDNLKMKCKKINFIKSNIKENKLLENKFHIRTVKSVP